MAQDDFSFESILADVKSDAVIDGDIKTPNHILEAEAERILREVSGAPDTPLPVNFEHPSDFTLANNISSKPEAPPEPVQIEPAQAEPDVTQRDVALEERAEFVSSQINTGTDKKEPELEFPAQPEFGTEPKPKIIERLGNVPETPEEIAERLLSETGSIPALGFDDSGFFSSEPEFNDTDEIPMFVTPTEDAQPQKEDSSAYGGNMSFGSFGAVSQPEHSTPRFAEDLPQVDIPLDNIRDSTAGETDMRVPENSLFDRVVIPDDETVGMYDDEDEEEEVYEEPRLKDQAIKFSRTCNSISRRLLPASLITLIMLLTTFVYESGMLVPFGINDRLDYAAGALLIMQLIVMMLCIEIIIKGFDFLMRGVPNAETLVLFSCVFSLVSATFTILSGFAQMLPFCAVSALSLVFAAFGERTNLRAMTDSLKTVISSPEPYGVQAEYNENLDNSVLKKSYSRTEGFYTNLIQQDITEILYKYATPALLIAVLLLTIMNVLINRVVENSLHILSALLAAAAPFSLLLAYPLPFGIVARALRRAGVALAGWGGADDIAHTDGVCVTDDDMFPPGTLKLNSVKVFDGASQSNVLCYTGSLIIASGSGLSRLFAEALTEKRLPPLRVADFECHESGISAVIQGHQVATGSAAHMNLIGVRVPDDSNMRNAIFTAINNRLVAMFTVEYKPLPSVQASLISLLKWRIDLYFAMRDFNITPSMVGQKFKVPFESFVFMPVKESYSISDPYAIRPGRMSAVLVRESLVPYAEAITSARLLRSASFFATVLSIASAGLGVFLMMIMLWDGSFASATPGNLTLFMLAMLAAVLVVCAYVRVRR